MNRIDKPLRTLLGTEDALTLASLLRVRLPGWTITVRDRMVIVRNPHGACRKTVGSVTGRPEGWAAKLADELATGLRFRE